MRTPRAALVFTLAAAALGSGCYPEDTKEDPVCTDDPWSCAAGTVCWINTTEDAYACEPSGTGQLGEACQPLAGEPTCADGMVCIALDNPDNGTCTPFCDAAHPCPSDAKCLVIDLAGDSFHACNPLVL
ncbi:MAG: hypothetical protein U0271_00410 [Polyangiaceae bacterium]